MPTQHHTTPPPGASAESFTGEPRAEAEASTPPPKQPQPKQKEPSWHDHVAQLMHDVEQLWQQQQAQWKEQLTLKKLVAKLWVRNSLALVISTFVVILLAVFTWVLLLIAGGFALYELGLPGSLSVLAMAAVNAIPALYSFKVARKRRRELKEFG